MQKDTGYRGSLISMTGLRSRPGYGIQTNNFSTTVSSAIPGTLIFPPNPKRIYAIIQNVDDADTMTVYLGDTTTNADEFIKLWPGDSLLFDLDHPWSGAISGFGISGDCNCHANEIFLAGAVM